MITKFFILFFIIFHSALSETPRVGKHIVFAEKGLILREVPKPDGRKILVIPQFAQVEALEEISKTINVNGWEGEYQKIKFRGKQGFAFNAFISVLPKPPKNCRSLEHYVENNFKILKKEKEVVDSGYGGTVTNYKLKFKNGFYEYEYQAKENNFYSLGFLNSGVKYTDLIHILKACQSNYNHSFQKLNSDNTTEDFNDSGTATYKIRFNCEPYNCSIIVHQQI